MSDFVLSGVMSFLFADAVSARRSAYIADDGCIVAALNRVDPIVVPTDIDLEKHDCFEDINPRDPSAASTSARLFDDQAYRGSERCNRSTAPGGHKGVEHSVGQPCTRRHVCACLGTTEMMIVKNYVAPSNIHGVGLFAGENIQCGRKIFVLNDRIDIIMSKSAMQMYGPEFVRKAYPSGSGAAHMWWFGAVFSPPPTKC